MTAMRRMMTKVPTADVVITNPTHLAVALKYDQGRMAAPVVVVAAAAPVHGSSVDQVAVGVDDGAVAAPVARDFGVPVELAAQQLDIIIIRAFQREHRAHRARLIHHKRLATLPVPQIQVILLLFGLFPRRLDHKHGECGSI